MVIESMPLDKRESLGYFGIECRHRFGGLGGFRNISIF